jgi:type IV pilus assembly protein PilQ
LADFKGFNVVIPDTVKGSLTLRLKNVPWDQALDIILESQALGMRQLGNVIMIDRKSDMDERRRKELAAKEDIKKLEPIRTDFIQINYSKAEELNRLLRTKGEHSFLSDRGMASVDERTNTLIVQETAERLAEIRKLVNELDRPVRQVLIESKVVIATDDFTKDLGVKFGQSTNYTIGDHGWGAVTGGKMDGDVEYPTTYTFNESGKENYIVDLPAGITAGAGAAFGLAIGKVGSYLLQLELSALQQEGRGEVISSPRVITANQQQATIKQGVEVAVPGVAGVGATAAPTFKEAVLMLEVKPQITPDDRVIMDLKITKDNDRIAGGTFAFDKREVSTRVLVDNGETVVLGGVYERTMNSAINRVPFFGDLPVVGALFRRTQEVDNKRELLIFVTPKILKEKASWERS